jgi:hypothetical protein
MTTGDVAAWGDAIRELAAALERLQPQAATIGVAPPTGDEWYELLVHKLLPQCNGRPPVIAAVVGGTNIGKSALFNQLAGEDASAVSPLAAGTKHPVALVPTAAADETRLSTWFAGFTLRAWQGPDDALAADDADLLYWRTSAALPPQLILLDTPDVDSDARVNWQRADAVRQTADVLLAVLTQQKYNDAAVKRFFRHAAEAGKAVVVVFNQVDVALDLEVWPEWLAVFCRETGVDPLAVFIVPHDRRAAQRRGLTFHAVGRDGRAFEPAAVDVRRELSELRYDELKRRTLGGALARVVDPQSGADRYLREVLAAAGRFSDARQALADARRVGAAWPGLPAAVLVDEIGHWWDERRSTWSRKIHGFYRSVGAAVVRPVRRLWSGSAEAVDPLVAFRERERTVVVETVERLLDELDRLSRVGNEILRPRLEKLLGGAARAETLARIEAAHAALPAVDAEFRHVLDVELERWERENPRAVSLLRSLDTAAAWSRPAVSVSLALTGVFLPAGTVLGQTVAHLAGQTAGEIAAAAVVAGGGEAVVGAAGHGIKHAAAQLFGRLQAEHAERRAAALARLFETELLGDLLNELERGAAVATDPDYRAAAAAVATLRAQQHARG